MSKAAAAATVYGITGAVLLLFLVWPLAESVRGAFVDPAGRPTVEYLAAVLRNPIVLEGLRNVLVIAVAAAVLACIVGVGVALVLDRYAFPGKRWLAALVPLPLMVPPFVGALGIRQLLGQAGALNALLDSLKNTPPSQADVDKVKEQILRGREVETRQNAYWLGNIIARDEAGEDLGGLTSLYDEMVKKLTPAMLQAAAKQYFNTSNYARFVLLPEVTKAGQ